MDDRTTPTARWAAIWLGQLVSLVGSSLTAFVLGVWVYQRTGSVTQFSLIFLAATLPAVLFAPFAGALADRRDRRRLMLVADTVAAAGTAALTALVVADALQVWHIYLATAVSAAASTVHQVAYQAMTPALIGKRHLGRFNGLMQVSRAVQIAAPLIAGVLVVTIGIGGVMAIDLGTFVVAAATLLLVRLPAEVTRPAGSGPAEAVLRGATAGWRHLRQRPGLLQLMVVFGAYNFLFGIAGVLVQPLILSFTTADTLGVLMFAGGAGLFAGSLVMGAWGGPTRRVTAVCGGLAAGGVALVLHAAAPSAWLIGVVAPLFLFTLPIVNSSTMTLIQTKTEPSVLGRVLATARVIGDASVPLAYVLAGPIADGLFEPLLRPDGALADSVGRVVGTGEGRGIALLFAVTGVAMVLLAALAWTRPVLRGVDDLPDALPDDTADHDGTPEPATVSADPRPAS
ncbi:Major Facilitator Superfamily protein [Micromonospora nigra]|uniref:Major Facilitator Superfamily protein n=1 Tax=Micromonospora nigra TaxID=145857 RepID=A0A1C6RBJ7_9ACTN|nr:MFS transporter [Micromonospora nigra]SCL14526.1 Major Facilitator Superfamily protein [Micromonospora nigra]